MNLLLKPSFFTDEYYYPLLKNTATHYAWRMQQSTGQFSICIMQSEFYSSFDPDCFPKPLVRIDLYTALSKQVNHIFTACHEVAHALDHQRWPWLFSWRKAMRKNAIGQVINLFLEWHASRVALRYLRNTGNFSAHQLYFLKEHAHKSFKTYLYP